MKKLFISLALIGAVRAFVVPVGIVAVAAASVVIAGLAHATGLRHRTARRLDLRFTFHRIIRVIACPIFGILDILAGRFQRAISTCSEERHSKAGRQCDKKGVNPFFINLSAIHGASLESVFSQEPEGEISVEKIFVLMSSIA